MSSPEHERQVLEAVARYREAVDSMEAGGRPALRQQAAVKSVGRAIGLVSFVLKRAADTGTTEERLVELTGWAPDVVTELLQRPPEPALVARVTPPGLDAGAVARTAASLEAGQRLRVLLTEVIADIDDQGWAPAAADLDELHDRFATAWSAWRHDLGRR